MNGRAPYSRSEVVSRGVVSLCLSCVYGRGAVLKDPGKQTRGAGIKWVVDCASFE